MAEQQKDDQQENIENWLSPQHLTIIQEGDETNLENTILMNIKDEEGKTQQVRQRDDTQLMAFDNVPQLNLDNHGTSQSPPSDMMRMNMDGMMLSFEMRNPIDLSIDPTRQSNANMM
jgi:hypothetical protein